MKRLINDAPDLSVRDALAAEQQALVEQCRSEDFAEGIAAFAARRTPSLAGPIGQPIVDTTMPFTLGEDHLAFRQSVRTLARSRYADSMLTRSQSEKFPTVEFAELGAAGLLGLLISESSGGQGGDVLAVGIAVEELAYADPTIAYLAFAANVSNALLAAHGSDEVRQRWVNPGIAGKAVICLALTEPGAGSDAANLTTRATRVDGGWRISGEKTSITQAVHADLAMVVAQTNADRAARASECSLSPWTIPRSLPRPFATPASNHWVVARSSSTVCSCPTATYSVRSDADSRW